MTESIVVRPATSREIKIISPWLLEERAKHHRFRKISTTGLRGYLYRRWVLPRYLSRSVNTWVIQQDDELAGYAVVEQQGIVVFVGDLQVRDHSDRPAAIQTVLESAEELARSGEYQFVQVAPFDTSEVGLRPYRSAGYELLDYYLWAYSGALAGSEPPEDVKLTVLPMNKALDRRLHYLKAELDATEPAGRSLIDGFLLPKRVPTRRTFEIMFQGEGVGYLDPRPDERHDGILSLVLSLLPQYWGSELEAQVVSGFVGAMPGKGPSPGAPSQVIVGSPGTPVRVLLSTSPHCQRADAVFDNFGLKRELDDRPILFKPLSPESAA